MPEILEAKKVSKIFPTTGGTELRAVDNIDLRVPRKSFFTLIGPSGCGKSTLLSILAGIVEPSTGEVCLEGEPFNRPQPRRIALVFQDASLYPWRTVMKNVEFGLEIRGEPKAKKRDSALRYIHLVGLKGFENYYPYQLSGGMQQRVNLARALALETDLLLMDEPFGSLDEQTRLMLGTELTNIWQRTDKTIIFVTHSLLEAAYLSDSIAVMSARPGTIKELIEVDVSRPREPDMPGLVEVRRRIWNHIAEEAKKLMR